VEVANGCKIEESFFTFYLSPSTQLKTRAAFYSWCSFSKNPRKCRIRVGCRILRNAFASI